MGGVGWRRPDGELIGFNSIHGKVIVTGKDDVERRDRGVGALGGKRLGQQEVGLHHREWMATGGKSFDY